MGEADVAVDAVNAVLDSEAAHVGEILGDACDETLHVFDVTYNERGPMKDQLQEAVDNWEYMKTSNGHKVDQKLVKEDYALVRSIETDEDDGGQTVVVWFVMITKEPEGFS